MANINNLKRQHNEIMEVTDYILNKMKQPNLEENSRDIAKNINVIAGKLKIHLMNEDKYLYPEMLNSSNIELKKIAEKYYDRMIKITDEFSKYKTKYNTFMKINANTLEFKKDTKEIFDILKSRINKENTELYPLMDK